MSVIAVNTLFLRGSLALRHSAVSLVFGSLDSFLTCFRLFFLRQFNVMIDYHFTVYRLAYFNVGFIVVFITTRDKHYYDELDYEAISQITGDRAETLKVNYHYAKERIKEYIVNS